MSLGCFCKPYLHRWLQSGPSCHPDLSAPPSLQETAREHKNQMHSESLVGQVIALYMLNHLNLTVDDTHTHNNLYIKEKQ